MDFFKRKVFLSLLLLPSLSYANNLPSPEEVQGVINICAAGRSVEAAGEINISYEKLFSGGIVGEGKITDLGGIIASIEDDKLKLEAFKIYHQCIPNLLELSSNSNSVSNDTVTNNSIVINGSGNTFSGKIEQGNNHINSGD